MPMHNLIEYSDNYLKTLWQYCKDIPTVDIIIQLLTLLKIILLIYLILK